ncbi:MAG: tRNA 2-thiocytidine(32) synthetase TtcA [Bdellovibrionales bacterium]|nr:tRNA 2-thiocytidine(32) synthetase TtcA [Bdellovibrionales bacterium]
MNTCGITPSKSQDSTSRVDVFKRVTRATGKAIGDFNMIQEGDRILVAVSGGKDSWVLLHVLLELKKKAPVDFDLFALNIDQGYAGFRQDQIEKHLVALKVPFEMADFNIASIVEEKSKNAVPCSLCSRLRRGALYGYAEKHRCNKIALGHHMDDFIETLLLNQFFSGRTASMAPVLKADDETNTVIRPLVYVRESDIVEYASEVEVPIVCCQCPLACGQDVTLDHKRRKVKDLLGDLEREIPQIKNSLLSSLGNVTPSHMLDKNLWNF